MKLLFLATIMASCLSGAAAAADSRPPLLMVYADGNVPVGEVTATLTNPRQDAGILITAVEFTGQLPDLWDF